MLDSALPSMEEADAVARPTGGLLLSSISAGIPGEEEADSVVEPPLDDLEESPLGPPGVNAPISMRRGDGGDTAGMADSEVDALVDVMDVILEDVIEARVADKFF